MMVLTSDMNTRGGDFSMYYYNFLFSDNVAGTNCFFGGVKKPSVGLPIPVMHFCYMSFTRMGQIGTDCFSIN